MPQQVNFERTLLSTATAAGQNNTRDMALTVFSGMVLESFNTASVFYDRANEFMSVKQLNGAASAQWPIIGRDPAGSYHTPGMTMNEVVSAGNNVKRVQMFQKTITVDEYLVNALDIPFTDLNVVHFDVIAPFATKLGRNLAKILDRKIAALGVKASRAAQQVSSSDVYDAGFSVNTTGGATPSSRYPTSPVGAYNFRQDLAALAQKFDEASVPDIGRYMFITPHIKTVLRYEPAFAATQTGTTSAYAVSGFHGGMAASSPSDISTRVLGDLEGFKFVVTNNLPQADYTLSNLTGENAAVFYTDAVGGTTTGKYQVDCDGGDAATGKPVALALCSASMGSPAIGMVQATGLQTHMEDDHRRNTKFIKAQLMCGLDFLCPWSVGAITVSA